MSVRVCCDACGRPLSDRLTGEGRATLAISGSHELAQGERSLPAPVERHERHFCTGQPGDESSCMRKAIELLDMALVAQRASLGLEWRLVPTDTDTEAR